MGDCSRILANFYLQPYDKFVYDLCRESKCKYLRYADDQFIFLKDKNKLPIVIFKISKKLNSLGLSINQKKVKISTTKDLMAHRSFKIFDILKDDDDRNNKIKVEKFVDFYLGLLSDSGLNNIKDRGNPLLNRALFCPALKDINFSKKTRLLSCYLNDDYLKNVEAIHFEKIYKLIDAANRPDFVLQLNRLSKKLIHNAFHYELLNFYNKNNIDSRLLLKRIKKLSQI